MTNYNFDNHQKLQEEIMSEIIKLMNGEKDAVSVLGRGALSVKLKNLIALGAAIASQREPEVISVCVKNCLKSGATSQNIREVLQKAILMAEVPIEVYTKTVKDAIDDFGSENNNDDHIKE